jgi:hypothetical protein
VTLIPTHVFTASGHVVDLRDLGRGGMPKDAKLWCVEGRRELGWMPIEAIRSRAPGEKERVG